MVSGTQSYTDTYVYAPSGAPLELLRTTSTGTTTHYWYQVDGRGNVVALTDATGNVVDRYSYDLWGYPTTISESVPQQLRYGGYWWDAQLGWYWVSVRYYDPSLERWLQPDPSEQDGVHTYVYVGDDPVDATDPSGLSSDPCNVFFFGFWCGRNMAATRRKEEGSTPLLLLTHVSGRVVPYLIVNGQPRRISTQDAQSAAQWGVPMLALAGMATAPATNGGAGESDEYTVFYTAQGPADARRLLSSGEPWPTAPERSALGEGVYSFATQAEAEAYLAGLQRSYPEIQGLAILRFRVSNSRLASFRRLNVADFATDEEAEGWMSQYSKLWGGTPDHDLEYITRAGESATEHFFSSSVFEDLEFEPWVE